MPSPTTYISPLGLPGLGWEFDEEPWDSWPLYPETQADLVVYMILANTEEVTMVVP